MHCFAAPLSNLIRFLTARCCVSRAIPIYILVSSIVQGHRAEAVVDFGRAIELESDNPIFYHNRGFCHRNLGAYEKGEWGRGDGTTAQ